MYIRYIVYRPTFVLRSPCRVAQPALLESGEAAESWSVYKQISENVHTRINEGKMYEERRLFALGNYQDAGAARMDVCISSRPPAVSETRLV